MKVNESALEILYNKYSSKMMVVCSRYTSDEESAQELLQDGFIRVFENVNKLKSNINYEDYIRRIIVDIVVETYKKSINSTHIELPNEYKLESLQNCKNILDGLCSNQLLRLIRQLPTIQRLVFNLYVFEGANHNYIAEQLGILEDVSEVILFNAEKRLQELAKQLTYTKKDE